MKSIRFVVGDVCIDCLRCTEWSGSGKDGAGPNDQDMSGLSLRVYYYCSPGDFMLVTTYMYHPHVGLRGGWGTLVTNQP